MPKRLDDVDDESIGSFISRRFGSGPADNLASAIIHGIYAGDIYNLSARTILPGPWETESKIGSVLQGFTLQRQPVYSGDSTSNDDVELIKKFNSLPAIPDMLKAATASSVFTFKGGISVLTNRLRWKLEQNPKVVIQRLSRVQNLELRPQDTGLRV